MKTKLEEIAAKARTKTNLQFTSLCHHITKERVWNCLNYIPAQSASGIDGVDVKEAKENFENWINPMLQAVHRKGYKAPPVRRVWIPKPGKTERRPLGVPSIADRALQRSVSEVLSAIYEEDFLSCSFGGRPKLSAHHALSTLNGVFCPTPNKVKSRLFESILHFTMMTSGEVVSVMKLGCLGVGTAWVV